MQQPFRLEDLKSLCETKPFRERHFGYSQVHSQDRSPLFSMTLYVKILVYNSNYSYSVVRVEVITFMEEMYSVIGINKDG